MLLLFSSLLSKDFFSFIVNLVDLLPPIQRLQGKGKCSSIWFNVFCAWSVQQPTFDDINSWDTQHSESSSVCTLKDWGTSMPQTWSCKTHHKFYLCLNSYPPSLGLHSSLPFSALIYTSVHGSCVSTNLRLVTDQGRNIINDHWSSYIIQGQAELGHLPVHDLIQWFSRCISDAEEGSRKIYFVALCAGNCDHSRPDWGSINLCGTNEVSMGIWITLTLLFYQMRVALLLYWFRQTGCTKIVQPLGSARANLFTCQSCLFALCNEGCTYRRFSSHASDINLHGDVAIWRSLEELEGDILDGTAFSSKVKGQVNIPIFCTHRLAWVCNRKELYHRKLLRTKVNWSIQKDEKPDNPIGSPMQYWICPCPLQRSRGDVTWPVAILVQMWGHMTYILYWSEQQVSPRLTLMLQSGRWSYPQKQAANTIIHNNACDLGT